MTMYAYTFYSNKKSCLNCDKGKVTYCTSKLQEISPLDVTIQNFPGINAPPWTSTSTCIAYPWQAARLWRTLTPPIFNSFRRLCINNNISRPNNGFCERNALSAGVHRAAQCITGVGLTTIHRITK